MFKRKSKKIKSIFLGKKIRKYWEIVWFFDKSKLEVRTETLKRVKILEKEMNFEFKEGEEIYLDEQGKYATIEKKARDTNGNIVYNVTYVTEIIEDFDSNIKEKYEKAHIEEKKKKERQQLEMEKIKKEYDEFKKRKDKINKIGIVIQKLPNGTSSYRAKECHMGMNRNFIKYDVITTRDDTDINIFNYDKEGRIVSVKDKIIEFKN